MRSKLVARLFSDLGIEASHSRPRVSNDNPFSEAQFRTVKYRPDFPDRFGSIEHAVALLLRPPGPELAGGVGAVFDTVAARRNRAEAEGLVYENSVGNQRRRR